MTTPNYHSERQRYGKALEAAREAALDACIKALESIGVHVNQRLEESLWKALEDMS